MKVRFIRPRVEYHPDGVAARRVFNVGDEVDATDEELALWERRGVVERVKPQKQDKPGK